MKGGSAVLKCIGCGSSSLGPLAAGAAWAAWAAWAAVLPTTIICQTNANYLMTFTSTGEY